MIRCRYVLHYKMNHSNSKQHSSCVAKRNRTIQQEFIYHCAVVIQSRFKAYLQRKRYKAFLPIYRRVNELLLALYSGWKTRRIFKLPPIKNQINDIKLKFKKGQVSAARIAKRELCDEIERLGKKGRWVQILQKYRVMKNKSCLDGKENSSLYGNIKSKSIKNVFKDQSRPQAEKPTHKAAPTKLPIKQQQKEIQSNQNEQIQRKSIKKEPIRIDSFDQRPIKAAHSISICETESEVVQVTSKQGPKHSFLKKQQQKVTTKKSNASTARAKGQKLKELSPQLQKKQTIYEPIPSKASQNIQIMKASQVSKSSQASKKLQVTLASNLISSVKTNHSFKAINESSIEMKTLQASRNSLAFSKREHTLQVLQVYQDKYLQQKAKIILKMKSMDFKFTQGAGKEYQMWLSKY